MIRRAIEDHLGRETIEAAQPDEPSMVELLAAIDAGYDELAEAISG